MGRRERNAMRETIVTESRRHGKPSSRKAVVPESRLPRIGV